MQLHHKVDAVVIGAGMSGLAAGIRLAMFDKKVVILEKHRITGGLNSYYQRGKRKYDVGLHALTNFAHKAERGRPLTKLLKQLRIPYDQLELSPQTYSLIDFPETQLKFDNDFDLLRQEIADKFPSQIDSFQRLDQMIMSFNETDLSQKSLQAKAVVRDYISDDQLVEMLFCPALIYGSAWENDMDFAQFVVMYKALFKEGFSRPKGGVRTILEILETKFKQAGGEIFFGQAVTRVHAHHGKVERVETSKGMSFETPLVRTIQRPPLYLPIIRPSILIRDRVLYLTIKARSFVFPIIIMEAPLGARGWQE
jgi:phytoene dehydrogenase-like protein